MKVQKKDSILDTPPGVGGQSFHYNLKHKSAARPEGSESHAAKEMKLSLFSGDKSQEQLASIRKTVLGQ